jgi:hypothetical protein
LYSRRRNRACGSDGGRLKENSPIHEKLLFEKFSRYSIQLASQKMLKASDGPYAALCLFYVSKTSYTNFSSQSHHPPLTLNTAPLVAEESSLAMNVAIATTSSTLAKRLSSLPRIKYHH